MSYYSIHPDIKPILFIHIPKTAGTSIENWFHKVYGINYTITYKHATINYKNLNELDMFKFTSVRNPFSRAVSWYQQAYSLIKLGESIDRFNITGLTIEAWEKGFDYFIQNFFSVERCNPGDDILIGFSYTQFSYISIDDKIAVDQIIRFENLKEDFQKIESMMGTNFGLEHHKKGINSSLKNYKDLYTVHSKKMIEEIYKEDLEKFNYGF